MNPTLPYRPDREALLGFTLSVALVAGAMLTGAGLLSGVLGTGPSLILGALAAVAIALFGHLRERFVDLGYRAWNRLAKAYAGFALRAVTAIWYWTVLTVVSRTGARTLRLEGTPWLPRGTQEPSEYQGQGGASLSREARPRVGEFSRWAVASGRSWALVLLPLLFVLRALEARDPKAPPADMYTLY
jgi:hypothetical protein